MKLHVHFRVALGYFLIAAVFGLILRGTGVVSLPGDYKFLLHTHSHIALLGWVYLALTTLVFKSFLDHPGNRARYRRLYWVTQVALLGMLLSFPFQGYAFWSILFSTLFLLVSYGFFALFLSGAPREQRKNPGYRLIRASLFFMVLSSMGPWALGAIMNTLGSGSVWYRLAIYFYLHFQYNGWMVLALTGLGLFLAYQNGLRLPLRNFERAFLLLLAGIVLSFFLSVLWTNPPMVFYFLGGAGAVLQFAGFAILGKSVWDRRGQFPASGWNRCWVYFIASLFLLKMLLQLLTAFPYFAELPATYLDFTIGYLHLIFLGIITPGLFLLGRAQGLIRLPGGALILYILGFVASEILIFFRGTAGWLGMRTGLDFSLLIFLASLPIVVGVLWILLLQIRAPD